MGASTYLPRGLLKKEAALGRLGTAPHRPTASEDNIM